MAKEPNHSTRAHAALSASSSARWLACPPSALAAAMYPSTATEFTQEGTQAHQIAELIASGKLPPKDADREMVDCARGYADYIHEQTRSDDATVLLEQRVDFSPWVPKGFGTADCILIQGITLDVIDYKYGKGVAVAAEDNPQMKLYGLGALNEFGYVYEIERVRLHIYQPRLNNISTFETTADELLAWGENVVKPTAEKAAKGEGEWGPGEHCRFCPHAGKCRALTQMCTERVNAHGMRGTVPVLAPWEVADVLRLEPVISLWLKRVKDQALATLMNGGEVPGFKVVAGRGSRAWADDMEVAKILTDAGFKTEEITETSLRSVAGMEKALGKKKVAELVSGQIVAHSGAPTVVPDSDKRPKYDRAAETINDLNG